MILPLPKSAPREITDKLTRHYHWLLRLFTNWDSSDVLQAYLNALTHAYDPHSDYLNTSHAQDFSINMSLALFGIGAELRSEDGYCTIISLVPGGPAAKSKQLKPQGPHRRRGPGQTITRGCGGHGPFQSCPNDSRPERHRSAVDHHPRGRPQFAARSDPDSRRNQTGRPGGQGRSWFEIPDGHGGTNRLGIIDLPSFYATVDLPGDNGDLPEKSTTADVRRLIKKLEQENVSGIILDLRNNGGGSLEEAVNFTGLFVTNGPVVLVRSPEGRVAGGPGHVHLRPLSRTAGRARQSFQRFRDGNRGGRLAGLWPGA